MFCYAGSAPRRQFTQKKAFSRDVTARGVTQLCVPFTCVKIWYPTLPWSVPRLVSYNYCDAIWSTEISTHNYCYRRKTQQWLSQREVLDITYGTETWCLPIFAFSLCMSLCKANYWTTLPLHDLPQHTTLLPAPTNSKYKMSASPFPVLRKILISCLLWQKSFVIWRWN